MKDSHFILIAGLFTAAVAFIFVSFNSFTLGLESAYAAFRDGQAQVIEYSVPGQGMCRAVVLDGKRHVEACEEGPRAQSHD